MTKNKDGSRSGAISLHRTRGESSRGDALNSDTGLSLTRRIMLPSVACVQSRPRTTQYDGTTASVRVASCSRQITIGGWRFRRRRSW